MSKAQISWIFIFGIALSGFIQKDSTYRKISQSYIRTGEKIVYRAHYGLINAGEGIVETDSKIHYMNGRPCFKVDILGRTTGMFDLVMRVRDNWGTFIDTSAIVSQRFYQNIQEGKYLKKEIIDFDHPNKKAIAHRLNKKDGSLKKKISFPVPPNMQDMVSGYFYMRTLDYDTIKINQLIDVIGFYDDTTYTVQVKYLGRDKVKTKLGEFNAFVLSPIMPKNSFFRGKNPITAWISDDKFRIPLKVKADLIVGAVEIDIKSYNRGN